MDKRLLIITFHELNKNNGGANGSKGFLRCFANLYNDRSLIYPHFEGDTAPFIPAKYKLYPCRDNRSRIRRGLEAYIGIVNALYSFVKQHLKTHQYDIIVIDHTATAVSLVKTIKSTGAQIITIHHNVERNYLNDNKKGFSISFRIPFIFYAKKSERECLLNSDLNLTVTERDAATFRSWYQDRDLHAYSWGDFIPLPDGNRVFAPQKRGMAFVVTGSLGYAQSLYTILDFLKHYWPLVQRTYPEATLVIAGRAPSDTLVKACEELNGVSIVADPEDIDAIVRQADYYICPISMGSGLKLRLMDAFKQGLPVLGHEVSVAGYERMVEANCLFAYHDEQSFVDSLQKMVSTQVSKDVIYQTFYQFFSIEAGTNKLYGILKSNGFV